MGRQYLAKLSREAVLFGGFFIVPIVTALAVSPEAESRSERYVEKGKELVGVGDTQGAIFDFTEAIRVNPENSEAYLERGKAKMEQGNTDGAWNDFSDAIGVDSRQADAYFERSKANIKNNDWEGATEDLAEAIRLKPGHPPYHLAQADLRTKRKNFSGVVEDIDRLLDLARQGDYDPFVNPEMDEVVLIFQRGQAKALAGDTEGALLDLKKVIRRERRNPAPYSIRGDIKFAQGLNDSALADYTKAIKLNPKNAGHYFTRGLLYYSQDLYQKAFKDIDQGLRKTESDEGRDYARLWIWMIRAQMGELEKADEALAHQVENRPDQSIGDWYDTMVQFALRKESEEELLHKADDSDPITKREQLCEAYFYAAQWQIAIKEKGKAVDLLELCLDTNIPDFYEFKVARGQLANLRAESAESKAE